MVLWLTNRDGFVGGAGRENVAYGPGLPLAEWLDDQLPDLEDLWEHREQLSWARRILEG